MAKWLPLLNGNPSPASNFTGDNDFDDNNQFDDGTGLSPASANFKTAEAVVIAKLATLAGKADAMALVGSGNNSLQLANRTHTYTK